MLSLAREGHDWLAIARRLGTRRHSGQVQRRAWRLMAEAERTEFLDLALRRPLPHPTLTGRVLGDPAPGRSALDRKSASTERRQVALFAAVPKESNLTDDEESNLDDGPDIKECTLRPGGRHYRRAVDAGAERPIPGSEPYLDDIEQRRERNSAKAGSAALLARMVEAGPDPYAEPDREPTPMPIRKRKLKPRLLPPPSAKALARWGVGKKKPRRRGT